MSNPSKTTQEEVVKPKAVTSLKTNLPLRTVSAGYDNIANQVDMEALLKEKEKLGEKKPLKLNVQASAYIPRQKQVTTTVKADETQKTNTEVNDVSKNSYMSNPVQGGNMMSTSPYQPNNQQQFIKNPQQFQYGGAKQQGNFNAPNSMLQGTYLYNKPPNQTQYNPPNMMMYNTNNNFYPNNYGQMMGQYGTYQGGMPTNYNLNPNQMQQNMNTMGSVNPQGVVPPQVNVNPNPSTSNASISNASTSNPSSSNSTSKMAGETKAFYPKSMREKQGDTNTSSNAVPKVEIQENKDKPAPKPENNTGVTNQNTNSNVTTTQAPSTAKVEKSPERIRQEQVQTNVEVEKPKVEEKPKLEEKPKVEEKKEEPKSSPSKVAISSPGKGSPSKMGLKLNLDKIETVTKLDDLESTTKRDEDLIKPVEVKEEKQKVPEGSPKKPSNLKSLFEAPTLPKTITKTGSSTTRNANTTVNQFSNRKKSDKQIAFEEKRKQLEKQTQAKLKESSTEPAKPEPKKRPNVNNKIEETQEEEPEEKVEEKQQPEPVPIQEAVIVEEKKVEKITYHTENHYFLIPDKKPEKELKRVFDVQYLLSFRNWKISKETKLFDENLSIHLDNMRYMEIEEQQKKPGGGYGGKKNNYGNSTSRNQESSFNSNSGGASGAFQRGKQPQDNKMTSSNILQRVTVDTSAPQPQTGLDKWGRKDLSEYEELAKKMREEQKTERNKDAVRDLIKDALNKLTVDTYDEVKNILFAIVKVDLEAQEKFIEVLFQKAVIEKNYVGLYSRLCKDFDKELPQKADNQKASKLRTMLLDKCKKIFKDDTENVGNLIGKNMDQEEKEQKMKAYILGNVNFIGELINQKILSRKVVFQCLDHMLTRGKNNGGVVYQLNLEGIVILLDKFGTSINKADSKIKKEEFDEYNLKVNQFIDKLNTEVDNEPTIPGHIRFKVINLTEKKNRGWTETLVDKIQKVRGVQEVRDDLENEQKMVEEKKAGGGKKNKLDEDTLVSRVKTDLEEWRDYINKGNNKKNYSWTVIEELFKTYGHSLPEIISAYAMGVIDFVASSEDVNSCYEYIHDIVEYYHKKLTKDDYEEVVNVCNANLGLLSDFKLDNNFIVDVWIGMISILTYYGLYSASDLNKITDAEDEEQIKTIFDVIIRANNEKEKGLETMRKVEFVAKSIDLFESVLQEIGA